jgi:predicted DNA-binding antitoxin AbrB/MazE fold protein
MSQKVKAIYKGGVFIPQEPCDLRDGEEVTLTIGNPFLIPPKVTDPDERKRILEELVQNMRDNPIPADAPRRLTREELHERR